jgi:hypothetical protein
MTLGEIERIRASAVEQALHDAFERLRDTGASRAALLFDLEWMPTMDIVGVVADELERCDDLSTLTLIHPSAAMTFIASAIGLRAERVEIRTQRSVHDDGEEEEDTDATASRTMFVMRPDDRAEDFARRSVVEAKNRLVRRFALVFDPKREPPLELADILAEELLHSSVKEVGLVHPSPALDTVVAALRLRLPQVKIAVARQPQRKT